MQVSLREDLVLKFPHKMGPGKFFALGSSVRCNNFTWDTVETFSRILQPRSVRARIALRCQQDFSAEERSSQEEGFLKVKLYLVAHPGLGPRHQHSQAVVFSDFKE